MIACPANAVWSRPSRGAAAAVGAGGSPVFFCAGAGSEARSNRSLGSIGGIDRTALGIVSLAGCNSAARCRLLDGSGRSSGRAFRRIRRVRLERDRIRLIQADLLRRDRRGRYHCDSRFRRSSVGVCIVPERRGRRQEHVRRHGCVRIDGSYSAGLGRTVLPTRRWNADRHGIRLACRRVRAAGSDRDWERPRKQSHEYGREIDLPIRSRGDRPTEFAGRNVCRLAPMRLRLEETKALRRQQDSCKTLGGESKAGAGLLANDVPGPNTECVSRANHEHSGRLVKWNERPLEQFTSADGKKFLVAVKTWGK